MTSAAASPGRAKASPIIDLVAVAALVGIAVLGFAPTFDGPGYLVGALGALVLGLAIAWCGARWRWGILSVTGAVIAAYFLFGGALALPGSTLFGVIPTLETWRLLAFGAVTSFKDLLTSVPQVSAADGHALVPFLLVLVAATLAGSLALRLRSAAWSLLPVLVLLVVQILLGVGEAASPIIQGVAFAVVAGVWLSWRQRAAATSAAVRITDTSDTSAVAASRARRLLTGAVVLLVATGAGVATAAFVQPPNQRFVLRDFVVPPFDIRDYPSPLQSFRGIVRDDAETVLFTVANLPEGARIRLATMDAYSGMVYNVSDEGAGSSSTFTSLRSNMSEGIEGDPVALEFTIRDYDGVWLPDAGAVKNIEFHGDDADLLRRTTHYNDASWTGVVTEGLSSGDSYTVETVFPTIPTDAQLANVPFAPLKMPSQQQVPPIITEIASDVEGEAETAIERARALQAWLSAEGFFSHGLEGEVLSPSGHGAGRILALFGGDQMIGDDEQYAVAMTLMARQLGMPARVVMGWHADLEGEDPVTEPFEATGDNLHVWVEIAFEGVGWVPFDPTPDEDNVPNDQTTTPQANPRPQVLQPPPPAQEPADMPPVITNDREQEEEDAVDLSWIGTVVAIAAGSLGFILLLLAPFLVLGLLKARRRLRRRQAARTADRVSGGWDELVDNAIDLRAPVHAGATRSESAGVVAATFEEPRVTSLAVKADADVYGPDDPTAAEVEAFWAEVDDIVGDMKGSATFRRRMAARLSVRSLRRGRRKGSTP